jgi:hypothetical protein
MEQRIPLSQEAGAVKPDVVVYSSRVINAIVFDCKGGITFDPYQLERYRKLDRKDLEIYIYVFNPPQFSLEVCFVDFERNHDILSQLIRDFPSLVIGDSQVRKSGDFKKKELNDIFETPIPIERSKMVEPVSYYPFSELDDRGLIVKEVLRAIITILRNRRRRAFGVFNRATYENEEILKTIHPLYDILSIDHRGVLMGKVNGVIDQLRREYPKFAEKVRAIQASQTGSEVAISNLIETCEEIMKTEESFIRLDDR